MQVAAFCVSALGSGTMFVRWWRLEEDDRRRVWLLYGWFSGLMCVGSVFGAVAWAMWMQVLLIFFSGFTSGLTHAQTQSWLVQQHIWQAAFCIPFAIEFVCMNVAKLIVLERMVDFAVAKMDGMLRRVAVWGRVVMAAVLVGNAVIVCGSVAAAVFFKESSTLYGASRAAYVSNNMDAAMYLGARALQKYTAGLIAESVQQCCSSSSSYSPLSASPAHAAWTPPCAT